MSIFAGSGILAVILLIVNFLRLAKGNVTLTGGFLAHAILGSWVAVSWVGFLISLIFVVVDYAKS
jgi:hypothetical protein